MSESPDEVPENDEVATQPASTGEGSARARVSANSDHKDETASDDSSTWEPSDTEGEAVELAANGRLQDVASIGQNISRIAALSLPKTFDFLERYPNLRSPKALSWLDSRHVDNILSMSRAVDPSVFEYLNPKTLELSKSITRSFLESNLDAIQAITGPSSLFNTEVQRALLPAQAWINGQSELWRSIFPSSELLSQLARALGSQTIPPNLAEAGIIEDDDERVLEALLDGFPLFWIPRARLAKRIIEANGRQHRRAIIGAEGAAILEDCDIALDSISEPTYFYLADRLRQAIRLCDADHEAAQALAMTTLDTSIYHLKDFEKNHYATITKYGERGGKEAESARRYLLEQMGSRGTLVMLPAFVIYEKFVPAGPGRSPLSGRLNRHASLHRISASQYTKRNAVTTIMLATSLLLYISRWLKSDLERAQRRRSGKNS